MTDIVTDLPKVKPSVKTTTSKSKPTAKVKVSTEKKPGAKTVKAVKKDVKSVKADAKPSKSNDAKKPAKSTGEKKPVAKAKGGAITVDSIINNIANHIAKGKVEAVSGIDYTSGKSVAEGLTAKAAGILLKAYSDKSIAAITHGDAAVAKAAKEVLIKNAKVIRSVAITKYTKKFAGIIIKNSKLADAGKLKAADYRAVAFEL